MITLEITKDGAKLMEDGKKIRDINLPDDLSLGEKYDLHAKKYSDMEEKMKTIYFSNGNVEEIYQYDKYKEWYLNEQILPRLVCQHFNNKILEMLNIEKEKAQYFPVCFEKNNSSEYEEIYGIDKDLPWIDGNTPGKINVNYRNYYNKEKKEYEKLFYTFQYSKNIFCEIIFAQECLKNWGEPEDKFVVELVEKNENENKENKKFEREESIMEKENNKVDYVEMLENSKNVILHGAPGTGKTYLAKQIAAEIVSEGNTLDYNELNPEQKKQIEFVQFHPSYDYTDFVEGLRPRSDDAGNDGSIGFELRDGIFKNFVDRARENYEDSKKDNNTVTKETNVNDAMREFFSKIEFGEKKYITATGTKFEITNVDDRHIHLFIPENPQANKLTLKIDEIRLMLESDKEFEKVKDLTDFFEKQYPTAECSCELALYKEIKKIFDKEYKNKEQSVQTEEKNYVFIIDEINRGEISKIFGELFFSIDPGYRGEPGAVSTQYSSLHDDPDKKFYIPENVYIIGTMNDIDRSVDTFDFAMRRRFRFVEISAEDSQDMLDGLDEDIRNEAIRRMDSLNATIKDTEDLNENYQIGAAYFLKLKDLDNDFDALWNDYLEPLLREYVRGMHDEKGKMDKFEEAYKLNKHVEGKGDGNDEETSED